MIAPACAWVRLPWSRRRRAAGATIDEIDATDLGQRRDAVRKYRMLSPIARRRMTEWLEMIFLVPRHDVARIWKRWRPTALHQTGVLANMITIQMRAPYAEVAIQAGNLQIVSR
jgi:hypothetical protein